MNDGTVLTISPASLLALGQGAERLYVRRLMDQLTELGVASGAEDEVRTRCGEFMRSGRVAGFSTELELAAYVACGFAFGPGFQDRAPCRDILQNSELAASSKAELFMMLLDGLESSEPNDSEDELGEEEEES